MQLLLDTQLHFDLSRSLRCRRVAYVMYTDTASDREIILLFVSRSRDPRIRVVCSVTPLPPPAAAAAAARVDLLLILQNSDAVPSL